MEEVNETDRNEANPAYGSTSPITVARACTLTIRRVLPTALWVSDFEGLWRKRSE